VRSSKAVDEHESSHSPMHGAYMFWCDTSKHLVGHGSSCTASALALNERGAAKVGFVVVEAVE